MTTGYHICRPSDPKTVSCEILNSMDPFLDKKKVYGNIGPFEGKKKKRIHCGEKYAGVWLKVSEKR